MGLNGGWPAMYRLTVEGSLDSDWSEWFDGLTIASKGDGHTTLSGPVIDQAALHGLLNKVRDLGLSLLSLTRVEQEGG